jgi:hypothetical protein
MHSSQTSRKPHQVLCMCDDCGKPMRWKGIDWCITNNGYLFCSSCMCRRDETLNELKQFYRPSENRWIDRINKMQKAIADYSKAIRRARLRTRT